MVKIWWGNEDWDLETTQTELLNQRQSLKWLEVIVLE